MVGAHVDKVQHRLVRGRPDALRNGTARRAAAVGALVAPAAGLAALVAANSPGAGPARTPVVAHARPTVTAPAPPRAPRTVTVTAALPQTQTEALCPPGWYPLVVHARDLPPADVRGPCFNPDG